MTGHQFLSYVKPMRMFNTKLQRQTEFHRGAPCTSVSAYLCVEKTNANVKHRATELDRVSQNKYFAFYAKKNFLNLFKLYIQ